MEAGIERLVARIREVERALADEIEVRRARFRYRVERRRVIFEAETRRAHRAAREGWLSFLRRTRPLVVLTAPVIYALIVPLALLDLSVSLYQAVCFPVYRIARVRRRDYVAIDRQHLDYLNGLQKLNCMYCGYANGVIAYARRVAALTEGHWCPIKHARRLEDTHGEYGQFADYGDAEAFQAELARLRAELDAARSGRAS